MSALTDLFQSMANKIRSKTGTATTYTPPQMVSDGIDDVFDAGVASATTPITPSNAIPVSMTANTGYKPTTNGVAIEQIDKNINPSSTPISISNGEIIKAYGAGVVVDAVPTPTNLTPSNSSPADITSGGIYRATANGKAVSVITDVTPSSTPTIVSADDIVHIGGTGEIVDSIVYITPTNTDPIQYLDVGKNYRLSGNTGYAIKSYSGKTPSDTSPVSLTTNTFYRLTSEGYLVKTVSNIGGTPDKVYTANSVGTSGTTTITVTKKPRYAFVMCVNSDNGQYMGMYMVDFTKSQAWGLYKGGSSASFTSSTADISSMFSTVSSSQVVFKNSFFNTTKRLAIALYY